MDTRTAAAVTAVADRQDGLVTWGELVAAGLPASTAARAAAGLRRVHQGVWLTGRGRLTPHQRRLAATLTCADTVLSHASAADLHGLRPWESSFQVVTRPGSGGPRRVDGLLVCRSQTVLAWAEVLDGVRVTTAARTLVDLAPHLDAAALARGVREALRLGCTTSAALRRAVQHHRGRRGIVALREIVARLDLLPLHRARSDAESRALEILAVAGRAIPEVNVAIAGQEADLVWRSSRAILEVDGPQFHLDAAEDRRRSRRWREAGWTVHRIDADVVFDAPERLVALAARLEAAPAAR